jgi:hypothetical protein
MIKMDIITPINKDFFKIKKVLDELKVMPEYEDRKIILLIDLARETLKHHDRKTDPSTIKAYMSKGSEFVLTTMPEEKVLNEAAIALEERLNIDVAVQNLTALVKFWKTSSEEKDIYRPLIDELVSILSDVEKHLQEKSKIEDMKTMIKSKEDLVNSQEQQIIDLKKELDIEKQVSAKWEGAVRPLLNNANVIAAFVKYKSKMGPVAPNLNYFDDIVLHLLLKDQMRDTIVNISKELTITPEKIIEVHKQYSNFIEMGPSKTMLGIINKKEYYSDVEEFVSKRVKKENNRQLKPIKPQEKEGKEVEAPEPTSSSE